MGTLTPSQTRAIAARGNVLVMAGAGTGKTRTLVARCLDCLEKERVALDQILIVTFTEAAATEMRERLRTALEKKSLGQPEDAHWREQLALFDVAHIGTLHSFCLRLIREHFHELGLDPQLSIMDEGQARLLADEIIEEQFNAHYENSDDFSLAVQDVIRVYGSGRDEKIRELVKRIHAYAQTRPDSDGWLARQIETFSSEPPVQWREWHASAFDDWREQSVRLLRELGRDNPKAAECLAILNDAKQPVPELLARVLSTDGKENYPPRKFGALRKPLAGFFDDALFLHSQLPRNNEDPLSEDWGWVRRHMQTLLQLSREFSDNFSARKRGDGVLDFHDLEQFALKLLWNPQSNTPTPVAAHWQEKIRFVFVDEYQDINAAQDRIIAALSHNGSAANRFLVGDVKQSIYRFRLADPKIFRGYAKDWYGKTGETIALSENFRSRESLLHFVNSLFTLLMREETGGMVYDDTAQLQFGAPEARAHISTTRNPEPRAELLLCLQDSEESPDIDNDDGSLIDLEQSEKEARMLALRLLKLKATGHEVWDEDHKMFRPVEWRDVAVLLRSPSGKADIFAKQFSLAGIPLIVERGGFFDSSEILDLLSLLQLLDNPLQDIPLIAVLRSPLVGFSLDELAEIRLLSKGKYWFALNRVTADNAKTPEPLRARAARFLEQFSRWRKRARQSPLSQTLDEILSETRYDDWLKAQPRGGQRHANIQRFLHLAEQFDQFQRQGLYRFLNFVKAQRDTGIEPEITPVESEDAVRLMSIHQSKGLEFPVVALADLQKAFNEQDLRGEIIFDDTFGLGPRVKPPHARGRYPSLPYWLAQKNQKRELRGEELRLLYVALTRARDTLILSGSVSQKKWATFFEEKSNILPQRILSVRSYLDWFILWFQSRGSKSPADSGELSHLRWQTIGDAALITSKTNVVAIPQLANRDLAQQVQRLRNVLEWKYPFTAATCRSAKTSVTALRRQVEDTDDEAAQLFAFQRKDRRPAVHAAKTKLSAADTGIAHHKFLQHFTIQATTNADSLAAETERLQREGYLSTEEATALKLEDISAFWNSETGKLVAAQAGRIHRELPFTAKFSPQELGEILGTPSAAGLTDEFVIVQGVADLVVLLPGELWLIDFKTDDAAPRAIAQKVQLYAPQVRLYALALEKIYSRPVKNCWLHFLAARRTEAV